MKKIEFVVLGPRKVMQRPLSPEYELLSCFLHDYRYVWPINALINKLESVRSGENTFDDIHDPHSIWDICEGSGDFECDKETAYFHAEDNSGLESCEIPLLELINLLRKWQGFIINNKANDTF